MITKLHIHALRYTLIGVWIVTPLAFVLGRLAWDVTIAMMVVHIVTGR